MEMRKLGMEMLGTFFLVLTITTSVTYANPVPAIAIGLTLAIMVYIGGNISGAHYNPAVSLAVFLRGKLPARDLIPYWVAQIVGGIAAALIGYMITHTAPVIEVAGNQPSIGRQWGYIHGAIASEFLYTFLLALVVLTVATTKKHANNPYYGLCIGGTVMCAAFAVGPVSGGAFNPAVGLSLSIVGLFNEPAAFQWFWVYLVFPLLGGFCAAMASRFLHPDEVEGPAPSLAAVAAAAKAAMPAPAQHTPPPAPPAPPGQ